MEKQASKHSTTTLAETMERVKEWGNDLRQEQQNIGDKKLTLTFYSISADTPEEMAELIAREKADGNKVSPLMAVVCKQLEWLEKVV